MLLYRIVKKRYIRDLSGEGARLYGGRWNRKGTSVLYTSSHHSLALLEAMANTSLFDLPGNLHLLILSLPEDVTKSTINIDQLPENWQKYPAPKELQEIGTNWVQSTQSLLLKVPSVVVPDEFNFLINPHHEDFAVVTISEVREVMFDDRLGS